ncbi:MAG: hypothetical protein AB2556_24060 [Candidatus Thiodiazotropha sp.]
MAVVADEFYGPMVAIAYSTIFATVEDVLSSDIPQDDCSFEDRLKLNHINNGGAGFVDTLFPFLYFPTARWR